MGKRKNGQVVHAWGKHPMGDAQCWMTHGWYEYGNKVYDKALHKKPVKKSKYYAYMHVEEQRVKRYEYKKFFATATEREQYGPFDTDLFFGSLYFGEDPLEPHWNKDKD